MPTNAFNNLNEDKKNKILNAAIVEFKKYTYDQISINRIIQSIDLPRGSFYLYFKDKEDLYLYVIGKYHNIISDAIVRIVRENDNDLILSYRTLFDRAVKFCTNDVLLEKFLSGLNYNIGNKIFNNILDVLSKELVVSIKGNISIEILKDALSLLNGALVHSLTTYYILNVDIDEVRKKYYNQIDIISKGINNY